MPDGRPSVQPLPTTGTASGRSPGISPPRSAWTAPRSAPRGELLLTAPDTLLVVAETAGGDIVGYLLANAHCTFLANGPVAWVEEVMVEQADRRSGVGRRLMDRAEEWARSGGTSYPALASRRTGPFSLALGCEDSVTFFQKASG